MKTKLLITAVLAAASVAAYAVPAKRGVVHTMTQPDGSTVQLTCVGDEWHHYYLTTDCRTVICSERSYVYADIDADGNAIPSQILAHDPTDRVNSEQLFLSDLDDTQVRTALHARHNRMKANEHSGIGLADNSFPTKGQVKSVIFLVEYADVAFTTPDAGDYFNRMINQPGFSDNGGTGSAYDYFVDNSMGQFQPQFDVYGPITLPYNRKYYGENDIWGSDKNPQHMMLHAARILDETVDFSQYDTDGDGLVDNVYIIYAGRGESDGDDPDTVWPHSWTVGVSSAYKFDGVYLSHYACGNEMQSATRPDGIGTFVHEFSHVMGLPDLYNTEDAYADYTPGLWSTLDQGCYLNYSCTPPGYSAFERNALGWMEESLVTLTEGADCSLEAITDSNKAYLIPTDRPEEYFLFENRQQKGWDKYLPYHGMLIWHIDFNPSVWYGNTVNNDGNHQYVDLIEACNRHYTTTSGLRRYPFPGTSRINQFVYNGSPSFRTWAGDDLGMDVTEIKETGEVITFKVAGGYSGIADIATDGSLRVDGRHISAAAEGATITVTDMQGRCIARGLGRLDTDISSPGLYIVHGAGAPAKVAVR